jgi:hypothetical protein
MSVAVTMLAAIALQVPSPSIRFETVNFSRPNFFDASLKFPVFGGSALANFASAEVRKAQYGVFDSWFKGSGGSKRPRLVNTFETQPTISINRPNLISLYFTTDTFSGGAHGMTTFEPYTFAMVEGKPQRIFSKDIFTGNYQSVLSVEVLGQLMKDARAAWVDDGSVRELTPDLIDQFVVTPSGVTYLFQPYVMGPYAVGTFQVKVPAPNLQGILKRNLWSSWSSAR